MAQALKESEDEEEYRVKQLEVAHKTRDFLVQAVLNMEKEIYIQEADKYDKFVKMAKKVEEEQDKTLEQFYQKNLRKLNRDLQWKEDIFQ